jgi:hypothetical protein
MHEGFDIVACDASNYSATEQRLDVALDPTPVRRQRACLLGDPMSRHKSARDGIGKIEVAEFGYRLGFAHGPLVSGRISLVRNVAQQSPGFRARSIWRPRRAMSAYRVPALSALDRAVIEHVRHGITSLSPRAEAGQRGVPNRLFGLDRPHLSKPDALSNGHPYCPLC